MKKLVLFVLVAVAAALFFNKQVTGFFAGKQDDAKKEGKKKSKKDKEGEAISAGIQVVKKWNLPAELLEVSGIAHIDEGRFACVQDEEGAIFIYNTNAQKIENKIPFSGGGDYEGLTLVGNTAYVVTSDGRLYEVNDFMSAKPMVNQYKTPLTASQNIEGLTYDKSNKRLLLAAKDDKPADGNYKGIYAFDLAKKSMVAQPVYKVDTDHALLQNAPKKQKNLRPSAIGIHPVTGQIFVTDGPKARLLVMDGNGQMQQLYNLGKDFYKAEGITFSPEGTIYISNEGKKQPANIMQVEVK